MSAPNFIQTCFKWHQHFKKKLDWWENKKSMKRVHNWILIDFSSIKRWVWMIGWRISYQNELARVFELIFFTSFTVCHKHTINWLHGRIFMEVSWRLVGRWLFSSKQEFAKVEDLKSSAFLKEFFWAFVCSQR